MAVKTKTPRDITRAIKLLDELEATIAEPDYTDHFEELRQLLRDIDARTTSKDPRLKKSAKVKKSPSVKKSAKKSAKRVRR